MRFARTLVFGLSLSVSALPRLSYAQANGPVEGAPEGAAGPSESAPPAPPALEGGVSQAPVGHSTTDQARPPQAAPTQPAPDQRVQAQAQPGTPAGQWVYTQQYGWLWMPYAETYTHLPADESGEPYMYVYGPSLGWSWVAAPWVWGWGPYPYFGIYGPSRFAWYGWGPRWYGGYGYYGWRGYRAGPYAWHGGGLRPYGAHGGWRGGTGIRPAPSRVAPPVRSFAAPRGGVAAPRGGIAPRGGRR